MYGGGDVFKFSAGDSKDIIGNAGNDGTISGYDIIEDFKVGDGMHNSETFDIAGATSVVTAIAATGVSSLTIDNL